MSPSWQHLRACSVIGASHRRQNKPCQDASLSTMLIGTDGQLQLLAVADGHGSARYRLSHRGSALACQVAQEAVETWLACTPLAQPERWRRLLEQELPASIQERWLEAIAADWGQQPQSEEEAFSPLLYGSTLGLVLLAPQWWGCTGLGDWDLAAVPSKGPAVLLSEEQEHSGSETTGSLCQPPEQQGWSQRAQVQPLEAHNDLRALVLSTDGVRKSCATDADYLQLCADLVDLRDPQELEQGLSHITEAGSGDDVSLAMAQRPAAPPPRRARLTHRRSWGVLLLVAALSLGGWLMAKRETPLQAQARELCAKPEQIPATLNQRRAQFRALLNNPELSKPLQQAASSDPLGALIASSQHGSSAGCPALKAELSQQWLRARAPLTPAKGKMPGAAAPGAAPGNP